MSCSGDAQCPSSIDRYTRNHTFSNLTSNSHYTFSVVAINSVGSGRAGIVNVTVPPTEIIITTTTTVSTTVISTVIPTKSMITTTSNEGMTTTRSSEDMATTTTTTTLVVAIRHVRT